METGDIYTGRRETEDRETGREMGDMHGDGRQAWRHETVRQGDMETGSTRRANKVLVPFCEENKHR